VVIGAALYGVFWVVSPGKQRPVAAAVGEGSLGVVRFSDLAGDPGVRALAADLFVEAMEAEDARRRQELPPSMRWIEGFQRAQRGQAAGGAKTTLGWFLPREAVLSFEPGQEGAPASPLLAANFRGFVRPVRWMIEAMAKEEPRVTRVGSGGQEMLVFPDGPAVAFVGGTLVVSSDSGALLPALDRLGRSPGRTPSPLLAELEALGSWDVAGILDDPVAAQTVLRLLVALEPATPEEEAGGEEAPTGEEAFVVEEASGAGEAATGVEAVTGSEPAPRRAPGWALWEARRLSFGLDVETADRVSAELLVGYEGPGLAAEAVPGLAAWLDRLREGTAQRGMELTGEVQARGAAARMVLDLAGVERAIEAMMARLAAEADEGEER
jgi:hypothetical protein